MKLLATLLGIVDDKSHKIIAISPDSNHWFVNSEDLTEEYKSLAMAIEASGKVTVLGMLFGPGEESNPCLISNFPGG